MALSSERLTKLVDKNTAKAVKEAFDDGVREGKIESHKEILTWLQEKYMDPETRPNRDSPEAKAILALASDVALRLREELGE